METLKSHPIAECWPHVSKEDYAKLIESIRTHQDAELTVWVYEGMILDGRHRYHAAIKAGVTPTIRQYKGDDPIGFAQAMNDRRRHYTTGQLAMIAEKLATLAHGQKKPDAQVCASTPKTQQETAEKMGVSRRAVQQARRVREADPKVAEEVEAGEISLNKAEQIVKEKVAAATKPTKNGKHTQADILEAAKAEASELRKLQAQISATKKQLIEIAGTPIGKFIHVQSVEQHTKELHNIIGFALPHALCGYCDGNDRQCKACKGGGWVTKSLDRYTPTELRR